MLRRPLFRNRLSDPLLSQTINKQINRQEIKNSQQSVDLLWQHGSKVQYAAKQEYLQPHTAHPQSTSVEDGATQLAPFLPIKTYKLLISEQTVRTTLCLKETGFI